MIPGFLKRLVASTPPHLNPPLPGPVPQIPQQRPKPPLEDRLHRVELLADLRSTSDAAVDDWRGWAGELDETHVIPRLMTVMEARDRRGEGW